MAEPMTIRMRRRRGSGFTLIEAALVLFLFSVIALTFYQLFALGSKRILDVRRKLGATALASARMEMIRSLPYASIGTKQPDGTGGWTYGIPSGEILETETVAESGSTFTVHTTAQYADDAFDGMASGSPADAIPTDYKRIRMEISWEGAENGQRVITWGTFSPDGVEQPSNTGVLSVNVLNAVGNPVQGATVHIVSVANGINLSAETDAYGNQSWPGTPPGTDYMIFVSKAGHYGAQTYPAYPSSVFNPLDLPMSVVIGSVNQKSFTLDHSADITIRSEDPFGVEIPDVPFAFSGGYQVGTVPLSSPLAPVYDFTTSGNTSSDAEFTYAVRCYGRYGLTSVGSVAGYRFLRTDPGIVNATSMTDAAQVFDVQPGEVRTEKLLYADTSIVSLLFSVTRQENVSGTVVNKPVAGASVRLTNASLGYDATVVTALAGQAYFPAAMPALVPGSYQYEVTAAGYTTKTGSVTVTNSGLQDKAITLIAE
jgi:Tfp pilus assembly protein PilV